MLASSNTSEGFWQKQSTFRVAHVLTCSVPAQTEDNSSTRAYRASSTTPHWLPQTLWSVAQAHPPNSFAAWPVGCPDAVACLTNVLARAMPATTLALSPSIVIAATGRKEPPNALKRQRAGDPIYFSPSLASYTQHLFHARRPIPTAGADSPIATTMPRPHPPPTPGSSSDIRGKEGAHAAGLGTFNLPPTAYNDDNGRSSSTSSNNGSDSSYRPVSPGMSGKRPAGAVIGKEDFELPPPPTRSRKIIQMKPQSDLPVEGETTPTTSQQSGKPQTGGKRKQGAGTTAAGRKIARKTAHSLIERRRRSKMNEEFGVLKDMIPACKGQEMHKLAILQVGLPQYNYADRS